MNAPQTEHEWNKYLKFFSEQNVGRPTRLGVFERTGDSIADYWLESGGKLIGVDLDTAADKLSVQILIGELEHIVTEPQQVQFILSRSGDEDGFNITDAEGRTTVLRFETAST